MKEKHRPEATQPALEEGVPETEMTPSDRPEDEKKGNQLIQLLNHPWRLIKEGGKLGVNGVKHFLSVVILFSLANTALFFYAIYRLFTTEFAFHKPLIVLLVLLIGLGLTVFSAYKTYQYVIIDTVRVIHENLTSLFQKVSTSLVDKVAEVSQGKIDLTENQLTKALDIGKIVHEKYQKSPRFLRKGLILVLSKVPYAGMLTELKGDILKGKKIEASTKLYRKMDGFISDKVLGNNRTNWVWWLLPPNLIVLLLLIRYSIG